MAGNVQPQAPIRPNLNGTPYMYVDEKPDVMQVRPYFPFFLQLCTASGIFNLKLSIFIPKGVRGSRRGVKLTLFEIFNNSKIKSRLFTALPSLDELVTFGFRLG